jgi:hypothetical protein
MIHLDVLFKNIKYLSSIMHTADDSQGTFATDELLLGIPFVAP